MPPSRRSSRARPPFYQGNRGLVRIVWFGFGMVLGTGCEPLPNWQELPLLKEATSLIADLESEPADPPGFYSYTNAEGRTVYVSHEGLIPPAHRNSAARVDLSHVSLNQELGNDLDEAAAKEHAALASTTLCRDTKREAKGGLVGHAIQRYPHWLGIGGAVLLLILTAPWVASRVGAARWVRILCMTIPLLLFLGVLTQVARTAQDTFAEVQAASDLCEEDRLAEEDSTIGRLQVVRQLRQKLLRIHQERQQKIDEILSEAR